MENMPSDRLILFSSKTPRGQARIKYDYKINTVNGNSLGERLENELEGKTTRNKNSTTFSLIAAESIPSQSYHTSRNIIRNKLRYKGLLINNSHEVNVINQGKPLIEMIKEIKQKIAKSIYYDLSTLQRYSSTIDVLIKYFNGKELGTLYRTSKVFYDRIKNNLITKSYQYIIEPFIDCYQPYLNILSKTLVIYIDKNSKELYGKINLKVNIALPSKYEDNCILIENHSSWLINESNVYRNVYKFDYLTKENSLSSSSVYWITKEDTSFNYDQLNKAYLMPILPFQNNDIGIISVNLISSLGFINFNTFKWQKLQMKSLPIIHTKLDIDKRNTFDYSRSCEAELQKSDWKKLAINSISSESMKDITLYRSILETNFQIINIQWDYINYLMIKITAKALIPGEIIQSILSINIIIQPQDKPIENEIKKNGLLYDISNNLQIRVGDIIILYFSKSTNNTNEI